MSPEDAALRSRVLARCVCDPVTDCLEWQGALQSAGYGHLWDAGKCVLAHRAVMGLPRGKCVLHRCDNPKCCNPEHLSVGTLKENSRDMVAKGRQITPRGVAHGSHKLTEHALQGARALHRAGESYRSLARRFGVSHNAIANAVTRRHWNHLA